MTFENWLKLSVAERKERYCELSEKDKFKVRQGFYYFEPTDDNNDNNFEPEIPDFLKNSDTKK